MPLCCVFADADMLGELCLGAAAGAGAAAALLPIAPVSVDFVSFFVLLDSVFLGDPYQSFTPPCAEQAPRFDSAEV
jgi:hypothetical protein